MTRRVLDVGQCGADHGRHRFAASSGSFDARGWLGPTIWPMMLGAVSGKACSTSGCSSTASWIVDYSDGLEIVRQLKADPQWADPFPSCW